MYCYSTIKKNDIFSKGMDLKNIMLSEINQFLKPKTEFFADM